MKKIRVLIFGGAGMLGNDFFNIHKENYTIDIITRAQGGVKNFALILNQISLSSPDVILNFAAYTDVVGAQNEGYLEAIETNALGAQNVAQAAGAFGIPLIYLSTDYVFDGNNQEGYNPDDVRYPLNHYGMSKYLGEILSRREYPETIVVRTSALYGGTIFRNPQSPNHFINKIIAKNKNGEPLRVVSDQFTVPTSCSDLSTALGELIENIEDYSSNTLHLVNELSDSLPVSWYDYAQEIKKYFSFLGEIQSISMNNFPDRIKRPKYGILNNTSRIKLPDWKISLQKYLSH